MGTVWVLLSVLVGALEASVSGGVREYTALSYVTYEQHVARVGAYPCLLPTERLVPLYEALGGRMATHLAYRPAFTPLHRCGADTGCCQAFYDANSMQCAMATQEPVLMEFELVNMMNKRQVDRKFLEVMNHTSCSCQKIYGSSRQ